MRAPLIVILAPLILLGSACTSLSESGCTTADWEQIGEDDGDIGRTTDYFDQHLEACRAHGIEPDRSAWELGHQAGIEDYCSVRGGIDTGRAGRSYSGVCSPEYEPEFRRGLLLGRQTFKAENDIRQLTVQIQQYRYELQYNRSLNNDQRRRYQLDVLRLQRHLNNAEAALHDSEQRSAEALRAN